MNACERVVTPLPPEVASNPQPVLRRASVVSGGDANVLAEELEPLWITALLLKILEVFRCYRCYIRREVEGLFVFNPAPAALPISLLRILWRLQEEFLLPGCGEFALLPTCLKALDTALCGSEGGRQRLAN